MSRDVFPLSFDDVLQDVRGLITWFRTSGDMERKHNQDGRSKASDRLYTVTEASDRVYNASVLKLHTLACCSKSFSWRVLSMSFSWRVSSSVPSFLILSSRDQSRRQSNRFFTVWCVTVRSRKLVTVSTLLPRCSPQGKTSEVTRV